MVRLRHYDKLETARFVTFSCYKRIRLFNQTQTFKIFLDYLQRFRENNQTKILGYVIMPNHVHLVLFPPTDLKLGIAIGQLKSEFGYHILKIWKKQSLKILERLIVFKSTTKLYRFWQPRCYDHNCRTSETVREKINYCHMNPVRAGLVLSPEDWLWSSYNWYEGKRDDLFRVDEIEL